MNATLLRAPVLTFGAEPDGAPPPVLAGRRYGDYAQAPAGGPPMLVVRDRGDVLAVLADPAGFPMAGVTARGELRGCPLTGAEMQSPDGGLLNMDPPGLRRYRQRIAHLFTPACAGHTRPVLAALAAQLCASMEARGGTVDVRDRFAGPFTQVAVCGAMGLPLADWPRILEASRVAFAVVPGPAATAAVAAAWDDLYAYHATARRHPAGLAAQLAGALDGFTPAQVAHVAGTVANGFGAFLPVLLVCMIELLRRPALAAACVAGERSWPSVIGALMCHRALFPVALPRRAARDVWLPGGGHQIRAGDLVLPSLAAAGRGGPADPRLPFGRGPHFCPGAALTRVWLAAALSAFFGAFPSARLAGPLDWRPGTLSMPAVVPVRLR